MATPPTSARTARSHGGVAALKLLSDSGFALKELKFISKAATENSSSCTMTA
jgi:hypothetical protein